MKKAIIQTGGKQYVVAEGDEIAVELLKLDGQTASFKPLMIIDGEKSLVGAPTIAKASVTAEIVNADKQADKVTAIRYKAKKRVRTVHGHRQHQTVLRITKIA